MAFKTCITSIKKMIIVIRMTCYRQKAWLFVCMKLQHFHSFVQAFSVWYQRKAVVEMEHNFCCWYKLFVTRPFFLKTEKSTDLYTFQIYKAANCTFISATRSTHIKFFPAFSLSLLFVILRELFFFFLLFSDFFCFNFCAWFAA